MREGVIQKYLPDPACPVVRLLRYGKGYTLRTMRPLPRLEDEQQCGAISAIYFWMTPKKILFPGCRAQVGEDKRWDLDDFVNFLRK